MRLPLLLTVLISVAAPAHAEGARESRYGPTTPRQADIAAAAVRYDGPMLGWSNKRQASPPAAVTTTPVPTGAAPLANWAGYQPAPAAYAPPPPASTLSSGPPPPTSLYAAPRAAPVASAPAGRAVAPSPVTGSAPAKDWSSYRSMRMTGVAPAATAVAPPPSPPRQVAAANTGATGARYYSVDREYGLTPDAVPTPGPDTRVLITASEPPPPEPKDATPIHGSADWLAAGVAGDDDQGDSDARRAKTRNETL